MVDYLKILQDSELEKMGITPASLAQNDGTVIPDQIRFPLRVVYDLDRLNGVLPSEYTANLESGTITCNYRDVTEFKDHVHTAILIKEAVELGGVVKPVFLTDENDNDTRGNS
ncbi:MAG: hypothetical protein FOGNACKC_04212 [Anaerolineae bacterium]|nr:hypothetical protein [Anaerolineae bacterium]